MRPVLRQSPVAGFHVAELALEDPERMPDLGPHLRDDPVDLLIEFVQFTALGGVAHDAPEGVAILREGCLPTGMDVALVGPDRLFLAMQKSIPDLAIVVLGRGGPISARVVGYPSDAAP